MRQSNLDQKGIVVWLMGLSGAGKSTIATGLEQKLNENGFFTIAMDGDLVRSGVNMDLNFTKADRSENVRRVVEISKMLVEKNVIVICSFITPLEEQRTANRAMLGERYFEVFVDCPVAVCESRDVKGLYQKARNNEIGNFTGVSANFEPPVNPDLVLNSAAQSSEECVATLYEGIFSLIF
jgi:adenylylsulfate kinase